MRRIIILLFVIGCLSETTHSDIDVGLIIDDGQGKIEESLKLKEGQTVFDLLQNGAQIRFKDSPSGVFVESINGVSNDSERNLWWIYYVNDVPASVSCDKYVLKEGDVVLWVLKKF